MRRDFLTLNWLGYIFVLFLIAIAGGCHSPKKGYLIGFDPAWYSLQLMGKEANVSAFATELLREISHIEKVAV